MRWISTILIIAYELALLQASLGNQKKYQTTAEEMLAQFGESEKPNALGVSVWTARLAPYALGDYPPAITAARKLLNKSKQDANRHKTLGAILYRDGQHAAALESLQESDRLLRESNSRSSPAYGLYFQAMTQHEIGNKDAALEALQKANMQADKELSHTKSPPAWVRRLTLELLRKEAEGSIRPSSESTGGEVSQPAPTKNADD
ncbi:MAG: hypothetical protein HKN13_12710 [Rhodothermales bacterium]|nr:hypothetical protein [Rhodothermales bacterium]